MKKFNKNEISAYDLESFVGRFKHFKDTIHWRNLFYTAEQVKRFHKILEEYDENTSQYSNKELWQMKYAVNCHLHPQSKEPILYPARASQFAYFNIPLLVFMVIVPPTPMTQFWAQSFNQTYNFLFNYANRNLDNEYKTSTLVTSYVLAVSTAVVASLGTIRLANTLKLGKTQKKMLLKVAPYLGTASANFANLCFSRNKDYFEGITVYNAENGEQIEQKSKVAGKSSLIESGIQRALLPLPVFIFPPLFINLCKNLKIYPKKKYYKHIFNSSIVGISFWFALTVALAILPQQYIVPAEYLDDYLQNIKDRKGNEVKYFLYRKGL